MKIVEIMAQITQNTW